jgi:hypothetical protein
MNTGDRLKPRGLGRLNLQSRLATQLLQPPNYGKNSSTLLQKEAPTNGTNPRGHRTPLEALLETLLMIWR